ncbi:MAG: 2-C-methyl-D-erythritol 4-phosphate cytidylyltransferase [Clostridia bacterium]|nr:2-C-methyl-D-erythritol 4-phosphate cytidylyltransferase [Clostridia bacterium]
MYSFILLSAGKGLRFGRDIPKQYLLLAGKPMIVHTLERADRIDRVKEIIVVCEKEFISLIKSYVDDYRICKKIVFVEGGKTRQESVYNALREASFDNVIVQEAARPLVTVSDFNKLIQCPHLNVSYTYQIPYTVLKKNSNNNISGVLERNELVNIQLPQKFSKDDLLYAHDQALKEGKTFTEDASMVYSYCETPVFCLQGTPYNVKITEYVDLLYGEMLLKEEFVKESN